MAMWAENNKTAGGWLTTRLPDGCRMVRRTLSQKEDELVDALAFAIARHHRCEQIARADGASLEQRRTAAEANLAKHLALDELMEFAHDRRDVFAQLHRHAHREAQMLISLQPLLSAKAA